MLGANTVAVSSRPMVAACVGSRLQVPIKVAVWLTGSTPARAGRSANALRRIGVLRRCGGKPAGPLTFRAFARIYGASRVVIRGE